MPAARRLQTASQDALPEAPGLLAEVDALVRERTRFNPGRTHRYTLFRHWGDPDNYVAFVGMNPSGADEVALDRTVAKCERLARKWTWKGRRFGAFYMLNAFSLRATDSAELAESEDPVGEENDHWIRTVAAGARLIVPAWGKAGASFGRGARMEALLRSCGPADSIRSFSFNRDGSPVHPLYQSESRLAEDLIPFFARPRPQPSPGTHRPFLQAP